MQRMNARRGLLLAAALLSTGLMLIGWADAKSSLAEGEHSARLAEKELAAAQTSLRAKQASLRTAQADLERSRQPTQGRFADTELLKFGDSLVQEWLRQRSADSVGSAQDSVDKAERKVENAQRDVAQADRQLGSSQAAANQWLVGVIAVAAVGALALLSFAGPGMSKPSNPNPGPVEAKGLSHASGTMTGSTVADSGSKQSRWQLAGATLLVLGVTSTAAQLVAMQMFAPGAPLAPGEDGWSTGGLAALVGAIYMATTCQTWDDFKRRIGVVVVVVAALAFAAVYLMVFSQQ
jgi:hypothetical protein